MRVLSTHSNDPPRGVVEILISRGIVLERLPNTPVEAGVGAITAIFDRGEKCSIRALGLHKAHEVLKGGPARGIAVVGRACPNRPICYAMPSAWFSFTISQQ